jgi:error-prone DNA polymerase
VRGELRRTGPRGVSLRATGAWELPALWEVWRDQGAEGVAAVLAGTSGYDQRAVAGAAASRSTRPVVAAPPVGVLGAGRDDGAVRGIDSGRSGPSDRAAAAAARVAAGAGTGQPDEPEPWVEEDGPWGEVPDEQEAPAGPGAGGAGPGRRRVLVHASGFRQSPYADVRPAGGDVKDTRSMAGGAAAASGGEAEDEAAERRAPREAPRKLWHSSPGSSGY